MLIGFLGIFLVSFIEGNIYKIINIQKNRNFISAIISFIVAGSLFVYAFVEGIESSDFLFFNDFWFYAILIMETVGAYLYREAYYHYHEKYTIVNMFMFSTVYLMPIYAYVLNQIIPLNQDISLLNNLIESLTASIILFIGSLFYFSGKFKANEIHNLKILILLATVMLNNFYFSFKAIQTYNGILLYAFVLSGVAFNYLILAYKTNEEFKIQIESKTKINYIFLIKSVLQIIYIKAAMYIPVEIGPIVRRISQLSAGIIIDGAKLTKKESIGIFIILSYFLYTVINIYVK